MEISYRRRKKKLLWRYVDTILIALGISGCIFLVFIIFLYSGTTILEVKERYSAYLGLGMLFIYFVVFILVFRAVSKLRN